ncbi:alpha/beta fold hydrolase [Microbacterium aoyamense]|nr:alpha/beta fold hydrolase [Microbacterium aoyamense]
MADDADPAATWAADLAAAVQAAQSASGRVDVDAIGLRIGGAMLAAYDPVGLRTRILWEPVGGRAYLRLQQALLKISIPPGLPIIDDGVETPRHHFTPAEAEALRALASPVAKSLAPTAIVHREDDPDVARRLFDVSLDDAVVEKHSITSVIAKLDPDGEWVDLPAWEPERETTVTDPSSGRRVVDRLIRFGDAGLPGVLSIGADVPSRGESALLVASGGEPRAGNSQWAALSRHLAAEGVATLRVDDRLTGDGQPGDLDFDPSTSHPDVEVVDIADAAAWLTRERGEPVTLIAWCFGTWLALRAAARVPISRVIGLNLSVWGIHPDYWARLLSEQKTPEVTAPESSTGSTSEGPSDSVPSAAGSDAKAVARRFVRAVRGIVPEWVRTAVRGARQGARNAVAPLKFRLHERRARRGVGESVLQVLGPVSADTEIVLVFTEWERHLFEEAYGEAAVRGLMRRGRRITVHDGRDPLLHHTLFTVGVWTRFVEYIDAAFGIRTRATNPREPDEEHGAVANTR